MSELGHDLHAAFPQDADTLHVLKMQDARYRDVADRYHDTTREIARIEAGLEASLDERLETLKKERLAMLDEVAQMIAARKAQAA
ncbi:YdcH family protein [Sphingobium algorifonticola]|jgi:hypothetical protein|uniref:DUF465 domain-containing protein n=1 Tax=Sphingobium algorifonticola TaxID=2008318 RepID=A0A437J4H1_9SPHN|nr:DUF465 domain-containing protein [Sphingobium algorifonticola]RVT39561.1 DUF465 domain-containing protein [Sphingobium algorifonticola]